MALGRALFLFFGRLVLTVVVPAEELEALHSKEFKALIWSYTSATLNTPLPPTGPGAAEAEAAAAAATMDEASDAPDGDAPPLRDGDQSPVHTTMTTMPPPAAAPESSFRRCIVKLSTCKRHK
eukprot:gene8335-6015_t